MANNNKEKFLDKYSLLGNISKTCQAIGVSRTAYYNWVKEDEEFAEKVVNAKESLIDEVEGILMKKIRGYEHSVKREKVDKNGQVHSYNSVMYFPPCFNSMKLFLEAKARHRGYGMKLDDSDAGQHGGDE